MTCAVPGKMRIIKRMDTRKMLLSIAEALMIYGLIAFSYGILVIHVAQTWSGDWPVDRNMSIGLSNFVLSCCVASVMLSSFFSTSTNWGFGQIFFSLGVVMFHQPNS